MDAVRSARWKAGNLLFIFYVSDGILHRVMQLIQYTSGVCWCVYSGLFFFLNSSYHIFNKLSDLVSSKSLDQRF